MQIQNQRQAGEHNRSTVKTEEPNAGPPARDRDNLNCRWFQESPKSRMVQ